MKHPVALVSLSSSHVAIYGADPSEEGENKFFIASNTGTECRG
jgi:hypothetical protein